MKVGRNRKMPQLQLTKKDYGVITYPREQRIFNRKIHRVLAEGKPLLLVGEPAEVRALLSPVYLQHQLQLQALVYGRDGRIQLPDDIVYTAPRLFFIDDAGLYNPFHLAQFVRLAKRFCHRVVMSVTEVDDVTDELRELLGVLPSPLQSDPASTGLISQSTLLTFVSNN